MPCGFSGDTGTSVTTNRTQCPPSGSTTSTCPVKVAKHIEGSDHAVASRHTVIILKQHMQGRAVGGFQRPSTQRALHGRVLARILTERCFSWQRIGSAQPARARAPKTLYRDG